MKIITETTISTEGFVRQHIILPPVLEGKDISQDGLTEQEFVALLLASAMAKVPEWVKGAVEVQLGKTPESSSGL